MVHNQIAFVCNIVKRLNAVQLANHAEKEFLRAGSVIYYCPYPFNSLPMSSPSKTRRCPVCRGSGAVAAKRCAACNGSGVVPEPKKKK